MATERIILPANVKYAVFYINGDVQGEIEEKDNHFDDDDDGLMHYYTYSEEYRDTYKEYYTEDKLLYCRVVYPNTLVIAGVGKKDSHPIK